MGDTMKALDAITEGTVWSFGLRIFVIENADKGK